MMTYRIYNIRCLRTFAKYGQGRIKVYSIAFNDIQEACSLFFRKKKKKKIRVPDVNSNTKRIK